MPTRKSLALREILEGMRELSLAVVPAHHFS